MFKALAPSPRHLADCSAHMHTCTHAHMHTMPHMHTCTHAHWHMHTCTCTHTHAHMHTCTHAHTGTHTCTHAHIHTCKHAHMPTCTLAHAHCGSRAHAAHCLLLRYGSVKEVRPSHVTRHTSHDRRDSGVRGRNVAGCDTVQVKIPTDRETGQARGFAFVTFGR